MKILEDQKIKYQLIESFIYIEILVQPNSKIEHFEVLDTGILKLYFNVRPVQGAANTKVIEMLSSYLGMAKSRMEIIAGYRNRNKKVCLRP